MPAAVFIFLFLGLLIAGLLTLAVMGIAMMARGNMSGLALLLVGLSGGVVAVVGAGYQLLRMEPYEADPPSITLSSVPLESRSADPPWLDSDSSPGRQSDPNEKSSLEPTPSPGLGQVIIPPGRPEWVESPPAEEDNSFFIAVNSGPYETGLESRHALDDKLVAATETYIEEVLDRPDAARYVTFSAREIRQGWVAEEYTEIIEVSFGPMHQAHARLQFDQAFVSQLKERWQQAVVASRLAAASLFFVAVTALLGAVYSFLRLDTATRGYYTGRLQFGAGLTILGIIVAGVLAARWIPWL